MSKHKMHICCSDTDFYAVYVARTRVRFLVCLTQQKNIFDNARCSSVQRCFNKQPKVGCNVMLLVVVLSFVGMLNDVLLFVCSL